MFNPKQLANLLRKLRRKSGISRNQLAKLTGISRRTLARIESGYYSAHGPRDTEHGPRLSARTAMRLVKALLPPEELQRHLDELTRLSRAYGTDPLYKYLDVLYHYPAFLFHDSPMQQALREEFGDDYRHSLDLLLRSGFGTRNLGARLRAFRMQHDLTLVEAADLLDLSKSELHRLERSERSPSPRSRYKILRLLTLPIDCHPEPVPCVSAGRAEGPAFPSGHDFSRADSPVARRASSEGSQGNPRRVSPPPAGLARAAWLAAVRAALAARPPAPGETGDADPLEALRHVWLAGPLKTKELAAALGVSQPHLIRLLRGDRRPSRKLSEQLAALTSRL